MEKDQITAKDVSRAIGVFAAVPPDTVIAFAPVPGAKRVLHGAEILQIAEKHSLNLEAAPDVCFSWRMEPLDRDRVLEAMRRSLGLPDATIRIVEMSLHAVPHGELSFAAERLGIPARTKGPSPVLWRGDVIYGGGRRFAVWARVEITAPVTRIVATTALKAGEPIRADQIRAETSDGFPSSRKALAVNAVIGMMPARAIPVGTEVRDVDLIWPKDVNPGESVSIELRSGSTRLAFTATAVTPGCVGDTISLRNPESKRLFRARVTGKGTAAVQPGWTRAY